ncbi:MAG: C39 family peptidase [Plectolyngbya sp. WJT66-NPBG17]|jgi:uncharacterized protein YvpB|nr:C39 family peptidase [Plectolyngbya sp. WJT66-NPBG17]
MKLKVLQSTTFKRSPVDSSELSIQDKVTIPAGEEFEVHSYKPVGSNHVRIALVDRFLGNPPRNTWYVYQPHIQIYNQRGQVKNFVRRPSIGVPNLLLPQSKLLNVPYHTQLNNAENPKGACNVTSFAMVMRYFRISKRTNAMQFEDELYRYMENKGLSRHDPEDLAVMAENYGLKDDLTLQGRMSDIRKAIAEGKPCILHGYFTSFGHIIVVRGYDQTGLCVNDPFGEWFDSGYRNDLSGENLSYSYNLIQRTASPEGSNFMWLHRLSKA